MIPVVEQSSFVIALYWLLMFPVAVVVLVSVTEFWADNGPGTWFEAARATLLMGLAVFLAFDLSGYAFARLMQSPQLGIVFPPDYGYWNWIREPLCVKWQVLGFVPMVRYLPVLFALLAGGSVQVLLWHIPFRQGMLVFVSQIIVNVCAMALLSLVFSFFIGMREGAVAATTPQRKTERRPSAAELRKRNRAELAAAQEPESPPPAGLPALQQRVRALGHRKGPLAGRAWERWEPVNRVFEPAYALVQPVTRYLPLPVQDFLNGGGWLIAGPGLAAFAWYGWRRHRGRPRKKRPDRLNA